MLDMGEYDFVLILMPYEGNKTMFIECMSKFSLKCGCEFVCTLNTAFVSF